MIFQGGRSVARLGAECLGSRRTVVTFSRSERRPVLNILLSSSSNAKYRSTPEYLSPLRSQSYADQPVSRPKAHTGRTSATQRRAPTTSATKAAKKPAPKRTAPKAIPNAKSNAKPTLKPKPKPRKKAKAKPKPRRKVLTDKQKTAQAAKQRREKVKDLKEKARLNAPKPLPSSAWVVFSVERTKAHVGGTNGKKLTEVIKESAAQYRAMTPEQLEHYNHIANQNLAANKAAYVQWVESYTPQEIREANAARRGLVRLFGKKSAKKYPRIHDDRLVRHPQTAYIAFYQSRYASGDFKGLKVAEAAKLAGREWKALSAAEKKPFIDGAEQDKLRHAEETKTVYKK